MSPFAPRNALPPVSLVTLSPQRTCPGLGPTSKADGLGGWGGKMVSLLKNSSDFLKMPENKARFLFIKEKRITALY